MNTANQAFEVVAGLGPPPDPVALRHAGMPEEFIPKPGEPTAMGVMPEYTKQWVISSDEWYAESDPAKREKIRDHYQGLADAYAAELRRSGLNWVRVEWIKF